jgi:hypothetical protein
MSSHVDVDGIPEAGCRNDVTNEWATCMISLFSLVIGNITIIVISGGFPSYYTALLRRQAIQDLSYYNTLLIYILDYAN